MDGERGEAEIVGADLGIMERDSKKMRGEGPFLFSNAKSGEGIEEIAEFIIEKWGQTTPPTAGCLSPFFIALLSCTERLLIFPHQQYEFLED